jgi:hypothetical protein
MRLVKNIWLFMATLLAPAALAMAELPSDTQLLDEPVAIERFLEALDGSPPDWATLHGANGARHDETLFALNRKRDRQRAGRTILTQRITFMWDGVLSRYDPATAGFGVAIGPKLIATRWGIVRFKPEGLPAEFIVQPPPGRIEALRDRLTRGETVPVTVAMTGRLDADEALIYDFAHEDPTQGMIMPMVRIERIDYLLAP